MIIRLEFNTIILPSLIESFLQKPKGTCLDSSSAQNITPIPIKVKGSYISFWFIEDTVMKHFYGGKVCIHSLLTYPGIIGAKEILHDEKITRHKLDIELSEQELVELLEPFL